MQTNWWHHILFHFLFPFSIWKVWKGKEKITKTWISWKRNELFRWNAYNNKDSLLISKHKEIFNKLANERLEDITKFDEKVNPDDLIYKHKGSTADAEFDEFDNAPNLLDKIRGEISLADAENDQAEFKSNLSKIKKENKKHRSKENKNKNVV